MSRPLLVLVHGAAWEDRYQAVTVAVTAAAMGERVTVALFFEPLRRWVEGRFDEGAPPVAGPARVAGIAAALLDARALGLQIVACDTAVRLAALDVEATRARVDRIASLPALWGETRDGRVLSF